MAITFELGRLVATRRVWEMIDQDERFSRFVTGCLTRYIVYDWGELDPEDWKQNDEAAKTGERILASYPLPFDVDAGFDDRLWIITESDRSVTTLLFPGDY